MKRQLLYPNVRFLQPCDLRSSSRGSPRGGIVVKEPNYKLPFSPAADKIALNINL